MSDDLLTQFLDWMRRRRYAEKSVRVSRPVVRAFLAHLEQRGEAVSGANLAAMRDYLRRRRALYGPPDAQLGRAPQRKPRQTLLRFLAFLAAQGIAPPLPPRRTPSDPCAVRGFESVLREYRTFLADHRGSAPGTLEGYLDYVGRLCRTLRRHDISDWNRVTPELLYAHLRRQARRLGPAAMKKTRSAWRSFFRFLRTTGRCARDLATVLVRCRTFSQASLPPTVAPEKISALLAALAGDDPLAIRNRAILVLLLAYGLRGGEVARLTLDDIRWRAGSLVLRRRKGGRDLTLPLLPAVAEALVRYLREARPADSVHRQVFLDRWGQRPFARSAARVLRGRIAQLRLGFAPHALRHTWASVLLNRGCPLAHLSVLLGHADFDSTRIYAKVDLTGLREVARLEDLP